MSPRAKETECIVIGAGISGLMCAGRLQAAGVPVTILEKSRGVGGRMATRRVDEYRFDHGAQVIENARGPFTKRMPSWLADGLLHECPPGAFLFSVGDLSGSAYCSPGGMTTLPRHFARNVDVTLRCRVTGVSRIDGGWRLTTDSDLVFESKVVILTSPVPQTLEILRGEAGLLDDPEIAKLAQVTYEPCIALMAVFDNQPLQPGNISIPEDSPIAKVIDNYVKGVSPIPGAITMHATAAFSREHFEVSEETTRDLMLDAVRSLTGKDPSFTRLHRWRYSRVTRGLTEPHLLLKDPAPIGFAGDAFGRGNIDGAAISGVSVAEDLLATHRAGS